MISQNGSVIPSWGCASLPVVSQGLNPTGWSYREFTLYLLPYIVVPAVYENSSHVGTVPSDDGYQTGRTEWDTCDKVNDCKILTDESTDCNNGHLHLIPLHNG